MVDVFIILDLLARCVGTQGNDRISPFCQGTLHPIPCGPVTKAFPQEKPLDGLIYLLDELQIQEYQGLQVSQKAVRAMTYLNPRSARLKGDIAAFPRLSLIQDSAIILYPNLVRIQTAYGEILIEV
ncbi:MAG: hypothetical protein ABIL06_14645 [Pseudomonadota bacterium]